MGAGKGAGIFNIALVAWYIRAAVSYILDGSNNFASSLSLCVYMCVCVLHNFPESRICMVYYSLQRTFMSITHLILTPFEVRSFDHL